MDTMAERLRSARERSGISQSELARRVGVAPQSIQAIEAGKVRHSRAMGEIAVALDVAVDWLDPSMTDHARPRQHVLAEATFSDSLTISIRANRPFDDTVRRRLHALLELNGLLTD